MRVIRDAQASIFENFSNHEYGVRLEKLSQVLDQHPAIVELVAQDLVHETPSRVGRMDSAQRAF